MKPYFAKYLPVEGEIKEGDKAIDENICSTVNNKIVTITFDKYGTASDGRGTYSTDGVRRLKKVKLFLCSRDIQVGDDIFSGDGRLTGSILSEEDKLAWKKDNPYKVVGEISPEAVWVKEGDEFEYSQVSISYSCEMGDDCDIYHGEQLCRAPHNVLNPIEILCPTCNKFH